MNGGKRYRVEPDGADLDLVDGMDDEIDAEDDVPEGEDGAGAFHDPVLRRALAHAPDHAVMPMDETRESIMAFAHEAVAPSLPAASVGPQRNGMQRVLGMRGGGGLGGAIPWNAVLAMALVGVVVAMRDRQPATDTQPDVARSETAQPAAAVVVPPAPAETAAAATPATPAAPEVPSVPPVAIPEVPPPAAIAFSSASATAAAPPAAAASTAPAEPTVAAPTAAAPVVESPADAAARAVLEQKLQRLEAAEAKARLAQQFDAGGSPTSLYGGALPRTAIPVEVPLAARAGRTAPTPAAAPVRAEDTPPPSFAALAQWTRLTITSAGGETRRVVRADARELGALVGSAALAGVGAQTLSGRVDWRIAFERNGEPLATLEMAGNQIRWKENGVPAGTGAPSASALASLRQALKDAQSAPVNAAEPAAGASPSAGPTPLPAPAPAPAPGIAAPDASPPPTSAPEPPPAR